MFSRLSLSAARLAVTLFSCLCLLLLIVPFAQADNHWQVTYSCTHTISTSGTWYTEWLPETDTYADATPNDSAVADMGDTDGVYSASSSDTVTATLTWVDDDSNPAANPPKNVIV